MIPWFHVGPAWCTWWSFKSARWHAVDDFPCMLHSVVEDLHGCCYHPPPYSPDIESLRILTIPQQAESTQIYTLIWVCPRGPCSLCYNSRKNLRIFTPYNGRHNLRTNTRLAYLSKSALLTVFKNKQNLLIFTIQNERLHRHRLTKLSQSVQDSPPRYATSASLQGLSQAYLGLS